MTPLSEGLTQSLNWTQPGKVKKGPCTATREQTSLRPGAQGHRAHQPILPKHLRNYA